MIQLIPRSDFVPKMKGHTLHGQFVKRRDGQSGSLGFTLAEVIIVAALSAIILTSLSSSMLFLAKGQARMDNFSSMAIESRLTTQYFGKDVRSATKLNRLSDLEFSLLVPSYNRDAATVHYQFDPTKGELIRAENDFKRVIMRGVENFNIKYLTAKSHETNNPLAVKKISMEAKLFRGPNHRKTTYKMATVAFMRNSRLSE